ncbi:glycosyltransferase [Cellulomonas fengjieae]|uniref:Glycosyltransferase family 2 protein n=1 Tax=Cellulomonas fengjieae TaxID=2819978 RepID=A0ABS3SEX1_9CELL|nr:glycosyltransferase family 2 protein [Cellulomonas fengjieae]MBO3083869.1 glycosyltransferase family 2 protein [Cellulomonas fengjieae]MBO3101379.1 glycosyltransferase family 2 protein [Cellulomonas fengjieae]QVI64846.1 glycosyltransferase family 2 protein [Cellulomonas fengjieae]
MSTAEPALPPAVRVVCVVYHPGDELATFARTLATASTAPVELVIVDNGTDASVAREVADEFGARLVATGANLGYGGGANAGAAGTTAPWIVVANSDIEWQPGSLDVLLEAGRSDPRIGSVGPTLLNTDGTVYPSARELPSLTQGAGHALFVRFWPGNPWTRRYRAHERDASVRRPAGWLSGACLLLRREAFEAVGGFDDGYFMFFEDVDLGERLGRAGWVNLYVPEAQVTHVGGTSWRAKPAAMISAHHASAARYVGRRYPHWYQWPVRMAATLGLRLRERAELRAAH